MEALFILRSDREWFDDTNNRLSVPLGAFWSTWGGLVRAPQNCTLLITFQESMS